MGSPETVAEKIIRMVELLDLDRFMIHMPIGSLPHENVMHSIQLFGEKVAPLVRKHFDEKSN